MGWCDFRGAAAVVQRSRAEEEALQSFPSEKAGASCPPYAHIWQTQAAPSEPMPPRQQGPDGVSSACRQSPDIPT